MEPHNHQEDLHISQGRKEGSTGTLEVGVFSKQRAGCVCVCAHARPGQGASSPAVSDVTVGLCVSGVWNKSITESKKPNATNHGTQQLLRGSLPHPLSSILRPPEQSRNVLIEVRGRKIATLLHVQPLRSCKQQHRVFTAVYTNLLVTFYYRQHS